MATPAATSTTVVNNWPADARIVDEGGVSYRVDPGGARVRLGERGLGVDVDPPSVETNGPDIEVETN